MSTVALASFVHGGSRARAAGPLLVCAVLVAASPGCSFDAPNLAVQAACVSNPAYQARDGTDHRYHWFDTQRNYDEAYATCSDEGAYLVVVDDMKENAYVRSLMTGDNAWIGYDDLDLEGTFQWIDGSKAPFTDWASGQPDNVPYEDCVALRRTQGADDFDCEAGFPFLCECEPGYRAPAVPACMSASSYDRRLRGRRYRYERSKLPWQEAEDICQADGGHLAVVSDIEEDAGLDSFTSGDSLWIGYSDQENEDEWRWVTGSTHPFERFAIGEPNGLGNENCAEFRNNGEWNDQDCLDSLDYVCECDPRVDGSR